MNEAQASGGPVSEEDREAAGTILGHYPEAGGELARALVEVARAVGCNPYQLADLIWFESGHTFRANALNPGSGAVGLIQFTPTTAKRLGTTIDALASTSAPEQARRWVRAYLDRVRQGTWPDDPRPGDLGTLQALSMSVFYPAARTWAPSRAFPSSAQVANPGIRVVSDYLAKVREGRLVGHYGGAS